MRRSGLVFMLLLAAYFKADSVAAQKKITINFHNMIGDKELVPGDSVKCITGEAITIERFKYYVSNFSVTDDKGNNHVLPVEYFLIGEADPSSKTITLTVPGITIRFIHFLLGVDSIRNVSGIQSGALDPLKGMFWTWNSGYVMAKLEGTCESSALPGHRFVYHIGGFRSNINTARKIDLAVTDKNQIDINADINSWFKSKTELVIKTTPVCETPGALAVRIADNYANMFSIR